MKYIFVVLLLVLFKSQGQTETFSSCSSQFVKVSNWEALLPSVNECLKLSGDFNDGLALLCTSDRSQLSNTYLNFLNYKSKYEQSLAVYQSLHSPGAVDRYKVQKAKEAWEILGNKNSVQTTIERLNTSFHMCAG